MFSFAINTGAGLQGPRGMITGANGGVPVLHGRMWIIGGGYVGMVPSTAKHMRCPRPKDLRSGRVVQSSCDTMWRFIRSGGAVDDAQA